MSGDDLIPPSLIITQPKAKTVGEVLKKLYGEGALYLVKDLPPATV